MADVITRAVREEVKARSHGYCEFCGMPGAVHMHHRKLRRHGDHRALNLLHVHLRCHDDIHHNPDRSYELGHLVRGTDDPATIPVLPPTWR